MAGDRELTRDLLPVSTAARSRMREFVFDVAIRPVARGDLRLTRQRWEALVPALPGLRAEAVSDIKAFERLKRMILPFLARRLASGQAVPRQEGAGQYLGEYGLVFWQFLCVRLGPLRAGDIAVEAIFPDIDELMTRLDDSVVEDQPL